MDEMKYEIVECICCWYDLLGFGTPFVNAKWDLTSDEAQPSINRIINEADYFRGMNSLSYAKKLHINDGIVSNFDIDNKVDDPVKRILIFLEAIFTDFESLNFIDKRNGYPGVRGVVTIGHRVCYDNANTSFSVNRMQDVSYHPREFQMNTAFSKAFIVEESGSKAGISGANIYIDQEIIDTIKTLASTQAPYQISENNSNDEIVVTIKKNEAWIATVIFDANVIFYQHRGIKTSFYILKSKKTIIDTWAEEAALQQARRYSLMDDDW